MKRILRTCRRVPYYTAVLFLCLCSCPTYASSDDQYWFPNDSFKTEDGTIDAIVSANDKLYVGGSFQKVDGKNIFGIAVWDGVEWNDVGKNIGIFTIGTVHTIVVHGDDIWVGGGLIAHWDGTAWNNMDGGTDRAVRIIARAANGDIYTGGEFTSAGGVDARGVARWDGQQWHALGAGVDNHVSAIAINGSDVYVGGAFESAGGKPAGFIARWDGQQWHDMNGGVNNFVTCIRVFKGNVYVGGIFSRAGNTDANSFAIWNGTSWTSLGGGVSGAGASVRAIQVDDDNLYIGGFFTIAGGVDANYIAKWEDEAWVPMGTGTDFTVKAITRSVEGLWVGGEFANAGGKPSNLFTRWMNPNELPIVFTEVNASFTGHSVELLWDVTQQEAITGFRVYRTLSGTAREVLVNPDHLIPESERRYVDEAIRGGVEYSYRVAAVRSSGSEIRSASASATTSALTHILHQNSPNPFNPSTDIPFTLPSDQHVLIEVYDAKGRFVDRLLDEIQPEGTNRVSWFGTNASGAPVGTGVYFVKLTAGETTLTKKMVLVK